MSRTKIRMYSLMLFGFLNIWPLHKRDIFVESVVEKGAVLSGSWPAVVLQFIMIAGGNHGNGLAFVISFKRLKVSL